MPALLTTPLTDPRRVEALRESGLMDTSPEESFDRVTRLTCKIVHVPAAMISLVDSERQFIKSATGLAEPWAPGRSLPVGDSICRHVIESGEPLLVPDARKQEQVRSTPAIRDLSIIAYAGLPLRVADGHVVGSLCAIDHMPRSWVADEVDVLADLAAVVSKEIGLRVDGRRVQRQADAAARRVEYFRSLIERAWDVIYVTDIAGVIREVSGGTRHVLGYSRDEIVGMRERDLAHPDDLPKIEEAFEQDLRSPVLGPPHDLRLRHRNGSWRAFEATRKVLADRSGSAVTIINAHDVTDRRRAEDALRRSEERFQLAARATNDVIREWDLVSGALTWCPEAHKTFRCAPEEMGTSVEWWYERIHPEDRERVIGSVQEAVSGVGEFWSEEYRLLRGDGSYATVLDRAYVARDARRVPERMIGSMVDVTERRRAEDAQRLIARASAALDSSLDCETIFGALARVVVPSLADVCIVHVSDDGSMLRRVAGFADPERGSLPTEEELFPEGSDPRRHPVLRALDSGKPSLVRGGPGTGSGVSSVPDIGRGRGLDALGFSSLLAGPLVSHDRVLGTITLATRESGRQYSPVDLVVVEDLARRAAVALENCRLYERSERAVRAREAVLGVVSHDLRNPLNAILMAATLLLERGEDRRGGTTRGLEIIRRSVHQMNGMIKDLLDASSIDAGHFRVAPSDRDVGELLAEVAELLGPLAAANGIQLACGAAGAVPPARVDTDQILRVFSNLIGNAVKFTPAGGSIRVTAERGVREVIFSVADTGPGIPAEQLPRVFDRYWQATRGDRRGAGLGLAIAKGIVEAHGGRIWVESTPGAGSTFRFTVGLGRAAAVATAQLEAVS